MFHSNNNPEGSLSIVANSANDMKDIEAVGKQDPYLQFSLDLNDKNAWQRTFVHKNAGQNATWNQSFQVPLRGEPDLFIEVLDEEKGVDEVIGFCTIPLVQVVQSPGGFMNGVFTLYNIKGENNGTAHLTLTARGFNSPPGYAQQSQPATGRSYVNEEHVKRVKSMRHKALAGDVGTSVLGGALALGAGFLANKLYQDHNRKEKEEEEQRAEFERQKQEAERQRQQLQLQQQQQQDRHQQHEVQYQHHQQQEQHIASGRHEKKKKNKERRGSRSSSSSSSSSDDDDEHKKKNKHNKKHGHGTSAWNPVGTYRPGDRVEYHGRTYVCLQGHSSNPTWMPNAAHSLWQLS